MTKIDIIIPCGGKGHRMKKIFPNIPKQLIKIQDKEILSWIVDYLIDNVEFNKLIFVLNENDVQIKSFLYSKYPKLNFEIGYQNKPLGLIHAISIGQQFAMSTNQLIFLSDTIYLNLKCFQSQLIA